MEWTEEKIKALSIDDYLKFRKEIKEFYQNTQFRTQFKIRENQIQRKLIKKKLNKSTQLTRKQQEQLKIEEKNNLYWKIHGELAYKKKYKECPWMAFLQNAISRCECKSNNSYIDYGFIGIQCWLDEEEIKSLWFGDEAYLLHRPSLDRKDPLFHYTYDNCQFIEMEHNISRGKKLQRHTRIRKTLDCNGDWVQLDKLDNLIIDFNFEKIRQKSYRREEYKKQQLLE